MTDKYRSSIEQETSVSEGFYFTLDARLFYFSNAASSVLMTPIQDYRYSSIEYFSTVQQATCLGAVLRYFSNATAALVRNIGCESATFSTSYRYERPYDGHLFANAFRLRGRGLFDYQKDLVVVTALPRKIIDQFIISHELRWILIRLNESSPHQIDILQFYYKLSVIYVGETR